ncbi:MAG: heavy metal translocating P-type ATPase [Deltaproteobacteria bacterium]|nr:MAG: heavy metal translocating P-type ATPase [Deltaproteobacteria bacterium]
MDMSNPPTGSGRIVHELPRRLRLRNMVFNDQDFDPAYMEAILSNIHGVKAVRFNLRAATVVVEYDGSPKVREQILNNVDTIPREAFNPLPLRANGSDPVGAVAKTVAALMTPVLPAQLKPLLSAGMCLPILAEGVATLFTRGIKIEVLDATSIGLSLARGDYFAANSIAALLGVAQYLEDYTEEQTNGLLKNLLKPPQESVWVERAGKEYSISLDKVVMNDLVICGPGEMIPIDGIVDRGEAAVDQSSITGESMPVHLEPGKEALSGSVISEGTLVIRAEHVGQETRMARINRFLEHSLRNTSPGQKKSEELANSLVPATFGLALAVYLMTRDIRRAAAVLTVDYSCAVKLAYPVAVKTAMHTAAHAGVLLKGAHALDTLARVDTLVFDKTGTLTTGSLEVTDVIPLGQLTPDEFLAIAAGAEEHYGHPVASAVVGEAEKRGLTLPPVGQVDFIVAHGVSAFVGGDEVLVGSRHFVEEDEGVDCRQADAHAETLRAQAKTLLYVARNHELLGIIGLRDTLRPDASDALAALKRSGIQDIVILTGDHRDTARALAAQLSQVDTVHWELKPEEKAEIVRSLRAQGKVVAFAGDGVNDGPALVSADLGICMPGGADLAREAAQVVLLKEDLMALATARTIAAGTAKTVKTCFTSSVSLNSLFLLLAGSGLISPVQAAVCHNSSTVGILGYAAMSGLAKPEEL